MCFLHDQKINQPLHVNEKIVVFYLPKTNVGLWPYAPLTTGRKATMLTPEYLCPTELNSLHSLWQNQVLHSLARVHAKIEEEILHCAIQRYYFVHPNCNSQ